MQVNNTMGTRHEPVKPVIELQRGKPVMNPSNPSLKGSQRAQTDHPPDRQPLEKEQQRGNRIFGSNTNWT